MRKILVSLSPADVVTIGFLGLLSGLNIIFRDRIEIWGILLTINLCAIIVIATLAYFAERKKTKLLIGMHRWYLYPAVISLFKEIYFMVRPIHPIDYDDLFIKIDYWMFGVNPTEWIMQFSHPIVTEILQVAYSSYYLFFVILGVEIYRRHSLKDFDRAGFLIVYGFFLSYLGYFFLPAVGPRFTLHDFVMLNVELPGLFFTNAFRDFVNFGESIPRGVPNPVEYVQRDVFPSGHTQLSLVAVYLAFYHKTSLRWFLSVLVTLLIIGTIYLRYHYVIDLVAGIIFCVFTIWSGHRLERWWDSKRKHLERSSDSSEEPQT